MGAFVARTGHRMNFPFARMAVPVPAPRSTTLISTNRGDIIGGDPAIRALVTTIDRVARSTCTVLVTGESGTGKELVVAALHERSARSAGPLVAVNCGAIPETLIESELFGHARGAFTGAHTARTGRVAAAQGGTLFLDEVGELPLSTQVKLLRLLQSREYNPIGEVRPASSDIRVVAATNRNLEAEVAAGRFREDLYYRLNVIHVQLPPLRERAGDIPMLADHFLRLARQRAGRSDLEGFTSTAIDALKAYDWPGNVRALENTLERVVLLAKGPLIDLDDLPEKIRGTVRPGFKQRVELPLEGIDFRAAIEDYENALLSQALERTGGNKNRAAALLGLQRTTFVEMLKRKGLGGGDARGTSGRFKVAAKVDPDE
jgi:sigma-54 specific flagellar transcriptional regulator A